MGKLERDSGGWRLGRKLERFASQREGLLLIILLGLVISAWAFIEIADEVTEGETLAFDKWVVLQLREPGDTSDPIGPEWVESAFLDITALGGYTVLTLVVLFAAGYMWLARKRHAMWLMLVASAGGVVLSNALKVAFGRPRPEVVAHLVEVQSLSFPSGHAMMSAVIYLTVGVLVAQTARRRALRAYVLITALVITFLVGVSRLFLGVHYPTDVLAGWSAGLAWALLCWAVAGWLQRRGIIERRGQVPGGVQ